LRTLQKRPGAAGESVSLNAVRTELKDLRLLERWLRAVPARAAARAATGAAALK